MPSHEHFEGRCQLRSRSGLYHEAEQHRRARAAGCAPLRWPGQRGRAEHIRQLLRAHLRAERADLSHHRACVSSRGSAIKSTNDELRSGQAKFWQVDAEYAEKIRRAQTPMQAKELGQQRKLPVDAMERWRDGGADRAMRAALEAKYGERILRERLLSTGDRPLAEQVSRSTADEISRLRSGE